jgi:hypothetical protein
VRQDRGCATGLFHVLLRAIDLCAGGNLPNPNRDNSVICRATADCSRLHLKQRDSR